MPALCSAPEAPEGAAKGPTAPASRPRNHCETARPARAARPAVPRPRPVRVTRFATIASAGQWPAETGRSPARRIPKGWPVRPGDAPAVGLLGPSTEQRRCSCGPLRQIQTAIAGRHVAQHVVGGDYNHAALFTVFCQKRLKLEDALTVERGERFIKYPQRRTGQIQPCQRHPTLLPGRQRVTGSVLETCQPDRSQRLQNVVGTGQPMQCTQPCQVLEWREQFLERGGMANPQQIACRCCPLPVQRLAIEQHLPGGRQHQPAQHPQQAGLAAAVGAADLQHLTGTQLQIKVLEQHSPIPLTRQRRCLQKWGDRDHQALPVLLRREMCQNRHIRSERGFKSGLMQPLHEEKLMAASPVLAGIIHASPVIKGAISSGRYFNDRRHHQRSSDNPNYDITARRRLACASADPVAFFGKPDPRGRNC
ncbi:hypothetical protein ALQ25_05627 [Pseudomonas coronafaciens pv. atropurpurea]|nr:hypothetical protein ALQ25_05627 [Pseudomonas coronafaciens pv. atropurpurea]